MLDPQVSAFLCHGDPGIGGEALFSRQKTPLPKSSCLFDQPSKIRRVAEGIDARMPDLSFDLNENRGLARDGIRPNPVRCRLQPVKQEKDEEKNR